MKTKWKLFFRVFALCIFFVACDKSNTDEVITTVDEASTGEPVDEIIEMGTVSLKTSIKEVIQVQTGKAPTLDELLDDMVVQILERRGVQEEPQLSENYRDLPENIPLAPGNYSLLISNYPMANTRFDTPVYGDFLGLFIVSAGLNTPLNAELELFDVAATINLSNELTLIYPDIFVTVEYKYLNEVGLFSSSLIWEIADNGRTGYLSTVEGSFGFINFMSSSGSMKVTVEATDKVGNPITVEKTYEGVSANQHYNLNIEQTAASTASLTVTLGDENVIDDTITFPN